MQLMSSGHDVLGGGIVSVTRVGKRRSMLLKLSAVKEWETEGAEPTGCTGPQ